MNWTGAIFWRPTARVRPSGCGHAKWCSGSKTLRNWTLTVRLSLSWPTYAVSPSREPPGVLYAYMWAREPKSADGVRPSIKESTRWIEGYERVAEQAAALPATRLVYVLAPM
ncbi:hypothetical protein CBM2586_P150007 [Cupriavidus phytorum]|uniref:Transposase n=4 Tax=Cupriavidus TaxID=106589 RepID=A0A976ADB0_9BURK|nr:hypothetical protein CBM2586_P150007 [Cupriavidus taiwanensis]SPC23938.1 hypothetical protein CT19431_P110030 [Cupriavidus taiwanensis]